MGIDHTDHTDLTDDTDDADDTDHMSEVCNIVRCNAVTVRLLKANNRNRSNKELNEYLNQNLLLFVVRPCNSPHTRHRPPQSWKLSLQQRDQHKRQTALSSCNLANAIMPTEVSGDLVVKVVRGVDLKV